MQKLGLTHSERKSFHEALSGSHTRRVRVVVTNLEGEPVSDLSHRLLDGQVNADIHAEVTRSAVVEFLDPKHHLRFAGDSPDEGAIYANRMLKIYYSVLVPDLDRYVTTVIFHGPIKLDGISRSGPVVTVEADGKEALALSQIYRPMQLRKGVRRVNALRTLLRERAGETRFAFPSTSGKLPKTRTLDRFSTIWQAARSIAASMDRQLFYSGNGVCTLRRPPTRPVFTFTTGSGGNIVSPITVNRSYDELKNVVIVRGRKFKGKKGRAYGKAIAPASHPSSPQRLGRNGKPRFLVEVIEDDSVRTDSAAREKARRVLDRRLRQSVEVAFDALPAPHLDLGDVITVKSDGDAYQIRLDRFSLPLAAGPMSVGDNRRLMGLRRKHIRKLRRQGSGRRRPNHARK